MEWENIGIYTQYPVGITDYKIDIHPNIIYISSIYNAVQIYEPKRHILIDNKGLLHCVFFDFNTTPIKVLSAPMLLNFGDRPVY